MTSFFFLIVTSSTFFFSVQESLLPESTQTFIELAMALEQLLELFALSHKNILGSVTWVVHQGLPSLHMAGPGLT